MVVARNRYPVGRGSVLLLASSRSDRLCRPAAPLIVFCHCNLLQHSRSQQRLITHTAMRSSVAHLGAAHTHFGHWHTIKHTCIQHITHLCMCRTKTVHSHGRSVHKSTFMKGMIYFPDETQYFLFWMLDFFFHMRCIFCLLVVYQHENVNNNDLSVSEVKSTLPVVSGWSDKCVGTQGCRAKCIGWFKVTQGLTTLSSPHVCVSSFFAGPSRSERRRGAPRSTWSSCKYSVVWDPRSFG